MKQDELNIEFKEFTEKLNLEEVVNIELESGFLLSFINHLLSKKPSVSDEEIERMASKYNLYRDEIRPFISGATAFRDTYYLPHPSLHRD